MLTLRRFRELADAFGANLQRWPDSMQAEAEQLLHASAEARAYLAETDVLDQAISAASARTDATLWQDRTPDISQTRLEAGIAAEIAALEARNAVQKHRDTSRQGTLFGGSIIGQSAVLSLQNIEIATCGVIAVAMGLWLGTMYAATFTGVDQGSILTLLQPAPLHLLF